MRRTSLVLMALLFCASATNAQNLVVNGSFEVPALQPGEQFRVTKIPGWTIKDEAGNDAEGEIQRGLGITDQEGKQWVELDVGGNTTMYQDIPTVIGQRYAFGFRDARRGSGANRLIQLVDGQEIGNSTASSLAFRNNRVEFVAKGAVTRIGLRAAGTSDSVGDLVDDIRVFAIEAQGTQDGYNYYFPYAAEGQGWRTSVVMTPASIDGFSYTLIEYGSEGQLLRRSSAQTAVNGIGTYVTPTANTGQFQAGWFHIKTSTPAKVVQYFRVQAVGVSDSETTMAPRVPASSFTGFYDNRGGLNSGLAVANPGLAAITLKIVLRNSFGETIREDSIDLPPNGNIGFVLKDRYAQAANIHGLVEVQATDTASGAEANFVAMGLRVSSTGGFTVIP